MDYLLNPTLCSSRCGAAIVSAIEHSKNERITKNHKHSRGQLLGSTQGFLSILSEGQHWVIPATHGLWVPPNVYHELISSQGSFKVWSVYVKDEYCHNLPVKTCMFELTNLLREAIIRTFQWHNEIFNLVQLNISGVIIDEIRTMPHVDLILPMPSDRRLLKIAITITKNPGDTRHINEWAAWAGISVRTLTRRFICETGLNFSQWRQRARLLCALEMIEMEKPITDIALSLGYNNISTFIALFRKNFGISPGRYKSFKENAHNQ